jgi:hypothetical protein
MVGPEAIVQQVWQQVVPTDWKIIRAALSVLYWCARRRVDLRRAHLAHAGNGGAARHAGG